MASESRGAVQHLECRGWVDCSRMQGGHLQDYTPITGITALSCVAPNRRGPQGPLSFHMAVGPGRHLGDRQPYHGGHKEGFLVGTRAEYQPPRVSLGSLFGLAGGELSLHSGNLRFEISAP